MITQEDIENLPADPLMAFVVLADRLDEILAQYEGGRNSIDQRVATQCAEDIYALIDSHDLENQFSRLQQRIPSQSEAFWEWWPDFIGSVRYYRTRFLITRRSHPSLVRLSDGHKQRIHTLLNQIREIIPKLGLSVDKQDAIFAKINSLATEVDKQRTSAEGAIGLYLQICSALGKGAEKLKPVAELIDKIVKTFGDAKADEPPSLPAPPKPKQIDPPPKQLPGRRSKAELDDDIPF
jgi:hypothetical protein